MKSLPRIIVDFLVRISSMSAFPSLFRRFHNRNNSHRFGWWTKRNRSILTHQRKWYLSDRFQLWSCKGQKNVKHFTWFIHVFSFLHQSLRPGFTSFVYFYFQCFDVWLRSLNSLLL